MNEARAIFAAAFRDLEGAVTVAAQVEAAYTPSGPSREELTRRIRVKRGLPTEGR